MRLVKLTKSSDPFILIGYNVLFIHSHRIGLLKEYEGYYKRDVSSKHSHPVRYRQELYGVQRLIL